MVSLVWAIFAVAAIILIAVAGALFGRATKRKRQEKYNQEIEQALAEDRLQEALNDLHEAGRGLFGPHAASLIAQLTACLARLGQQDRELATDMLPLNYPAFVDLAVEYGAVFAGRTVVNGEVTIYADSGGPDSFSTEGCANITALAVDLTTKVQTVEDVPARVSSLCARINNAAALTPHRCQLVKNKLATVRESVNGFAGQGYRVRPIRNMIKAAANFATRAETAMANSNFLTAIDHLGSADSWASNAEWSLKDLPQLEKKLRDNLGLVEQLVNRALKQLADAKETMRALATKYDPPPLHHARNSLDAAQQQGDLLAEKLASYRSLLDQLDIYGAETCSGDITGIAREVEVATTLVSGLPAELQTCREQACALHNDATTALAQLNEEIAGRKGTQQPMRRKASEIESSLANQSRSLTRSPIVAKIALLALLDEIRQCSARSLREHKRATGRQEQ